MHANDFFFKQCHIQLPMVSMEGYKQRILFTVGNVDRDIGRHSGRHPVDSRSTLGRQSVDIAVDSRSIHRRPKLIS